MPSAHLHGWCGMTEHEALDEPSGDRTLYLSAADLAAIFEAGNASFVLQPSRMRCSATLPHPAVARDDLDLRMIRDGLRYFGHGEALADPKVEEIKLSEAVREIYTGHPQAVGAQWSDLNRSMYAAVSLSYAERHGRILRATDALETLLAHTDIDASLPTSMFQPPHPALYVHFGVEWRNRIQALLGPALALSEVTPDQATAHGCYLLQSYKHCESCGRTNRNIGVYLLVELAQQPGIYQLTGSTGMALHDEDAPLSETLVQKFNITDSWGAFGTMPAVLVDLLAKLFLYMQTESARSVQHDEHSTLTRRLAQVGTKKQGKLQRRGERLYDWTEVGPLSLPSGLGHGALPPHWRHGHLRQQPYGPNHSLRKMIFIAPTLVRADKLQPSPIQMKA